MGQISYDPGRRTMDWRIGLYGCGAAGAVTQALYASSFGSARQFATVLAGGGAVAVAAMLAGVLVGFLFGMPRALAADGNNSDQPQGERYQSNTNLEQISDWLTKILVGVTLVQIGRAPGGLARLGRNLSPLYGGRADSPGFALATVGLFAAGGFLWSYLWARLFLLNDFSQASRLANQLEARLNAQSDVDARALSLASRQLSEGLAGDEVAHLHDSVANASALTAAQIFQLAREQHDKTWENDQPKMRRTVPVLQALADRPDADDHHDWVARLGFALSDQTPRTAPSLDAAAAQLDRAIEIRNRAGERPGAFYHWNRAKCAVLLERDHNRSANELRVVEDLAIARRRGLNRGLFDPRSEDSSVAAIGEWLDRHGGFSRIADDGRP